MFCTECGTTITANSKFCSNCGTNINLDEVAKTIEPQIVKNEESNNGSSNSANPEPKSLPAVLLLISLVVIPVCIGVYFTNPDIRKFVNNSNGDTPSNTTNRNDGSLEAAPATEAVEAPPYTPPVRNSVKKRAEELARQFDSNPFPQCQIYGNMIRDFGGTAAPDYVKLAQIEAIINKIPDMCIQ